MATIHERAVRLVDIYGRDKRGAERRSVMRDAASRAVYESDDQPEQPRLDYREWRHDWDWSMPLMIGSGRRASWHHQSYRWQSRIALAIHEDLGWSGAPVREMAAWLGQRHGGIDWNGMPPHRLSVEDVDRLRASASARHLSSRHCDIHRYLDDGAPSAQAIAIADWRLWLAVVGSPAWGRTELAREQYRLDHDPRYRTPSTAIGLIRYLRGETTGGDFRGCSGGEWLSALAEQPDLWDDMLARAQEPVRGKVGPLDAVYTLHGLGAPAEFDHSLVLGLDYEIRVRAADYEALKRSQPGMFRSHDPSWQFRALQ